MNDVNQHSWISSILAAFAASLCCIAPALAIFGGITGAAAAFSWIEPFRPYLIALTTLILGIAWYPHLKILFRKQTDNCCLSAKSSFWQTKRLLFIVTLISALLIAFPFYSSVFYNTPKHEASDGLTQASFKYLTLSVKGMSCADCTKHVDGALNSLNGIAESRTSYEKSQTIVRYDPSKISADSINHKIRSIGYEPTAIKTN
ncbi:MAG: mercuric transport protein MerTP [Bacteroidota bacterium]